MSSLPNIDFLGFAFAALQSVVGDDGSINLDRDESVLKKLEPTISKLVRKDVPDLKIPFPKSNQRVGQRRCHEKQFLQGIKEIADTLWNKTETNLVSIHQLRWLVQGLSFYSKDIFHIQVYNDGSVEDADSDIHSLVHQHEGLRKIGNHDVAVNILFVDSENDPVYWIRTIRKYETSATGTGTTTRHSATTKGATVTVESYPDIASLRGIEKFIETLVEKLASSVPIKNVQRTALKKAELHDTPAGQIRNQVVRYLLQGELTDNQMIIESAYNLKDADNAAEHLHLWMKCVVAELLGGTT